MQCSSCQRYELVKHYLSRKRVALIRRFAVPPVLRDTVVVAQPSDRQHARQKQQQQQGQQQQGKKSSRRHTAPMQPVVQEGGQQVGQPVGRQAGHQGGGQAGQQTKHTQQQPVAGPQLLTPEAPSPRAGASVLQQPTTCHTCSSADAHAPADAASRRLLNALAGKSQQRSTAAVESDGASCSDCDKAPLPNQPLALRATSALEGLQPHAQVAGAHSDHEELVRPPHRSLAELAAVLMALVEQSPPPPYDQLHVLHDELSLLLPAPTPPKQQPKPDDSATAVVPAAPDASPAAASPPLATSASDADDTPSAASGAASVQSTNNTAGSTAHQDASCTASATAGQCASDASAMCAVLEALADVAWALSRLHPWTLPNQPRPPTQLLKGLEAATAATLARLCSQRTGAGSTVASSAGSSSSVTALHAGGSASSDKEAASSTTVSHLFDPFLHSTNVVAVGCSCRGGVCACAGDVTPGLPRDAQTLLDGGGTAPLGAGAGVAAPAASVSLCRLLGCLLELRPSANTALARAVVDWAQAAAGPLSGTERFMVAKYAISASLPHAAGFPNAGAWLTWLVTGSVAKDAVAHVSNVPPSPGPEASESKQLDSTCSPATVGQHDAGKTSAARDSGSSNDVMVREGHSALPGATDAVLPGIALLSPSQVVRLAALMVKKGVPPADFVQTVALTLRLPLAAAAGVQLRPDAGWRRPVVGHSPVGGLPLPLPAHLIATSATPLPGGNAPHALVHSPTNDGLAQGVSSAPELLLSARTASSSGMTGGTAPAAALAAHSGAQLGPPSPQLPEQVPSRPPTKGQASSSAAAAASTSAVDAPLTAPRAAPTLSGVVRAAASGTLLATAPVRPPQQPSISASPSRSTGPSTGGTLLTAPVRPQVAPQTMSPPTQPAAVQQSLPVLLQVVRQRRQYAVAMAQQQAAEQQQQQQQLQQAAAVASDDEGLSDSDVAHLAWVMARWRDCHVPPAFVQLLVAAVVSKAAELSCCELGMALWALAILGGGTHGAALGPAWGNGGGGVLLAATHAALLQQQQVHVSLLDARALTDMVWAAAVLQLRPSRGWMNAFYGHLSHQVPHLRAAHMGHIMWAFAKLTRRPSAPLMTALLKQAEAVMLFTPSHLLRKRRRRDLTAVRQRRPLFRRRLTPHVASLQSSAQRRAVTQASPAWFETEDESDAPVDPSRALPEADAVALLMYGLGGCGFRPNRSWMSAFFRHTCGGLCQWNGRQLARCAWALVTLRRVPPASWSHQWALAMSNQLAGHRCSSHDLLLAATGACALAQWLPSGWLQGLQAEVHNVLEAASRRQQQQDGGEGVLEQQVDLQWALRCLEEKVTAATRQRLRRYKRPTGRLQIAAMVANRVHVQRPRGKKHVQ